MMMDKDHQMMANHEPQMRGAEHQRMMADVKAADERIQQVVTKMNAESGGQKVATIAELLTKNGGDCRRQRNFGYEDQGLATLMADRRGETEIDFGFTAAGHAVKEGDVKTASVCERVEPCEGELALGEHRRADHELALLRLGDRLHGPGRYVRRRSGRGRSRTAPARGRGWRRCERALRGFLALGR